MPDRAARPRLFLVTPPRLDPERFPAMLAEALGAADVAAVLITLEPGQATGLVADLVSLAQAAGAAALVADDTRVAGRLKADGVHIGTAIDDLRAAAGSLKPQRIVGAGAIHSRHAAMEAGEVGVDYLFFGRPHGDTHDEPHLKAVELTAWWSDLMEIPAVLMAGRSLASLGEVVATGADFVALHDAVWSHPAGPGEAIRQAAAMLADPTRRAA